MSFSLGIVGLPNVGKSTLFNALTKSKQADAQNYPFCTIDPNIGCVSVPDKRLEELAYVSKSKKIVPTAINFVDIAGLVKGASQGEGLGNKFLSHIREVDAIVQVVRAFTDPDVVHVAGHVNPDADQEVINMELALADLQTVAKRRENIRSQLKSGKNVDAEKALAAVEKVYAALEQGQAARNLSWTEEEVSYIRDLYLLTLKPMLYVVNIDEGIATKPSVSWNDPTIFISAKIESELVDLSDEEATAYLQELGMQETGLNQLIRAGYMLLRLVTYFTSGEPETRAWTIWEGMSAPEAAGVIHSDFAKGFVRAEVTAWNDFVEFGGWAGVKEAGKMHLEGKEYIVKDGDVCYFRVAT